MDELPFVNEHDSWTLSRDLALINDSAVETWATLRKSRPKFTPRSLSLLPDLQTDVLLEVLLHLHPLELVQLSRVCKSLRELLLAPVADSTWRNAFMIDPHIPRCPAGFSARRWTALLFGPRECEACHMPGVDVDYSLWCRLCSPCIAACEGRGAVPPSHRVLKVTISQPSEPTGCGDETLMAKIQEVGKMCQEWEQGHKEAQTAKAEARRYRIIRAVQKRLRREGFSASDTHDWTVSEAIWECHVFGRKPRLTSTVWNLARPYIMPAALKVREERLAAERLQRSEKRLETIRSASFSLHSPPPTSSKLVVPPPYIFASAYPPLVELRHDPSEALLTRTDPRLVAILQSNHARGFVDRMWSDIHAKLLTFLPQNGESSTPPSLDRIISVLQVPQAGPRGAYYTLPVLGWQEARTALHWCRGPPLVSEDTADGPVPDDGRVTFCPIGAGTAVSLARMVGFQAPEEVTLEEMNGRAKDERFVCANCPALSGKNRRQALSWRECIAHDVEQNTGSWVSHATPAWLRLSPLAAADARRRECKEGRENLDDASIWLCNVCDVYPATLRTRRSQARHLSTEHAIDSPLEGEHLLPIALPDADTRPGRRRPVPMVEGLHAATLRCKRCANDTPQIVKLWSHRSIVPHIQDRHLLERGLVTETEWTEVDMFL
ncbi:F-box domain-containing protein [Mycena indigotica]|uniref:F-box domain-containing protein n=1 Tax=Mycena indigotica TaxID=2126181 RepID=A0A8H6SEV9_9AGAR|nr:F-box domain-containing protein [Mycena indigotica]KAF7297495.1 F-box domain-containing protein [Mycena indigotica]